jgi:hypothetical protein
MWWTSASSIRPSAIATCDIATREWIASISGVPDVRGRRARPNTTTPKPHNTPHAIATSHACPQMRAVELTDAMAGRSVVNRPQFAGGSKVSMDGAYGKK